jgi:hypothetical protein
LISRPGGEVLPSGRRVTVEVQGQEERLVVSDAGGNVELKVRLTDQGPVLVFETARLEFASRHDMSVRCRNLALEAEQGITLRSGEDLSLSGQAVSLEGRRGEVALQANDDLVINGERVLVNCPTEEEVQRQQAAARSLKDLLELPFRGPGGPRRLAARAPVREDEDE